jgi:hypothetical protein
MASKTAQENKVFLQMDAKCRISVSYFRAQKIAVLIKLEPCKSRIWPERYFVLDSVTLQG